MSNTTERCEKLRKLHVRLTEETFRFRQDRLFEGEGIQQPLADLLPLVQGVYEQFVQQVVPGDILTLTFHVDHP